MNQDIAIHTLSSILNRVKVIIDEKTKSKHFWLKVEIANINFHRTGHVYLELAESNNGTSIAECSATLWNYNLLKIKNTIGSDIDHLFKKGNEILAYSEIVFDIKFGLKINIVNVDISFNLGQIEKRRKETIERLKKEGLIDLNKKFKIPIVLKRIALIGSSNTSGFTDFIKQIESNQYNYKFTIDTYSCTIQGTKAENEIIAKLRQLDRLDYDVIIIIRGGGSKMDLDLFNSYDLAKEIANNKHPVFTGIGHETDYSVADMVAHTHFKTPTAVANYIIELAYNFEVRIIRLINSIKEYKDKIIETKKSNLGLNVQALVSISVSITRLKRGELHTKLNRILAIANEIIAESKKDQEVVLSQIFSSSINMITINQNTNSTNSKMIEFHALNIINAKLNYYEGVMTLLQMYLPSNILERGYAIPLYKGKLYNGHDLVENEIIELKLKDKIIKLKYTKEK